MLSSANPYCRPEQKPIIPTLYLTPSPGEHPVKTALVCGAGGFIGSHLLERPKREGPGVRGVDLRCPEYSPTEADDFAIGDLREQSRVLSKIHVHGPQGVRDRNSSDIIIEQTLNWRPTQPLRTGLGKTYAWIADQVRAREPVLAGKAQPAGSPDYVFTGAAEETRGGARPTENDRGCCG